MPEAESLAGVRRDDHFRWRRSTGASLQAARDGGTVGEVARVLTLGLWRRYLSRETLDEVL